MPAIRNICLDVAEGEYLGIIGPNGGGKSTLLKAMLGLVPATSGAVEIYGKKPNSVRGAAGYVPQFSAVDKRFPITLMEVVLTGRIPQGLSPASASPGGREAAGALMERVGIAHLAGRRISDLSGGEFQKMLIARALASNPRLLLLDEPTASVDASSRDQIYALLKELNRKMTIILVTHDMMAISSYVEQIACLNETLVYHGAPQLTDQVVNKLYGCPVELIAHGVPHRVLGEHGKHKGGEGK
jgi:zinc transport system ATP-binding protein